MWMRINSNQPECYNFINFDNVALVQREGSNISFHTTGGAVFSIAAPEGAEKAMFDIWTAIMAQKK